MAQKTKQVQLSAIAGLPLFSPGDDLAGVIVAALRTNGLELESGDVVVVAQKVVSKVEGRYLLLEAIEPSREALELAAVVNKDPRLVQAILSQSRRVVRARPNVLIVEHRLGCIMANAGIDQSNVDHDGGERLLLLPEDPDASAAALKASLDAAFGVETAVVVNDSFGRPWRRGVTGVAIGAAGLPSLQDMVGEPDLFGRAMRVTQVAFADEVAAAASMVMGQGAQAQPVVLVRGLRWQGEPSGAGALMRPAAEDLFR